MPPAGYPPSETYPCHIRHHITSHPFPFSIALSFYLFFSFIYSLTRQLVYSLFLSFPLSYSCLIVSFCPSLLILTFLIHCTSHYIFFRCLYLYYSILIILQFYFKFYNIQFLQQFYYTLL